VFNSFSVMVFGKLYGKKAYLFRNIFNNVRRNFFVSHIDVPVCIFCPLTCSLHVSKGVNCFCLSCARLGVRGCINGYLINPLSAPHP
jgi:hypothetical protein